MSNWYRLPLAVEYATMIIYSLVLLKRMQEMALICILVSIQEVKMTQKTTFVAMVKSFSGKVSSSQTENWSAQIALF